MKEFGGLKSELIQPKNNAVSELDITTCEVAKAPYFFVDLYTHTTWIVWTNSMNNIQGMIMSITMHGFVSNELP